MDNNYGNSGGNNSSGQYSYGNTGNQGTQNTQYSYGSFQNYNGGLNNPSYNAYGQYGAGNGSPLDENGNPLKNRYGMKITFSILEILTVVFCNLLSFILGIVACVYTSKANTSYKQGRYADFKKEAKTSAVCLWVGLASTIVVIVCWVIFGVVFFNALAAGLEKYNDEYGNNYDYDFDNDYNYDFDNDYDFDYDYDFDNDYNYGNDDNAPYDEGDFWNYPTDNAPLVTDEDTIDTPAEIGNFYQFTLEGWTFTLPMSTADFLLAGFTLQDDIDVTSYVINSEEYITVSYYNGINGEYLGDINIYNPNTTALTASDCVIIAITINNSAALSDDSDYTPNFALASGLTFASTQQEVLEAYGMPNEVYNSDSAESYTSSSYYWRPQTYDSSGYWDELEIDFWDGTMDCVYIYYIGEY